MLQSDQSSPEHQKAIDAFKQEAIMLAHLEHPNLPRIFEHFEENGRWYLVMSFLQGETLENYLSSKPDGKLPLGEVVDIGTQLCTVLDYLHHQQPPIIFRDLKPANIMRTSDGHIYLIDFGIARHFKPGQSKDTTNYGSDGYAPPEQYGKAQTTPRSDIYSLGATLHQLLSGHDPASTPFHFPPLHSLAPDVPIAFATFITQMLEMDEVKRPSNMLVVKQELQTFASPLLPPGNNLTPGTPMPFANSNLRPLSPLQPAVSGTRAQSPTLPPGGQTALPQSMIDPNQKAMQASSGTTAPPSPSFPRQLSNTHGQLSKRKKRRVLVVLSTAFLLVILVGTLIFPHLNFPLFGLHTNGVSTPSVLPSQQSAPGTTSTATLTPERTTATPALSPTPSPVGQLLYQANWLQGLNGWLGSAQWKAIGNGELGSDGSSTTQNSTGNYIIWSPIHLNTVNYKIVAQIQFVRASNSNGNFEFGIIARGDGTGIGYEAGFSPVPPTNTLFCDNGHPRALISKIDDTDSPPSNPSCFDISVLDEQSYQIDTDFHAYEFDVNDNVLTLYIDGRLVVQTTDNSYLAAGEIGLRDVSGEINVKSFAVYSF